MGLNPRFQLLYFTNINSNVRDYLWVTLVKKLKASQGSLLKCHNLSRLECALHIVVCLLMHWPCVCGGGRHSRFSGRAT